MRRFVFSMISIFLIGCGSSQSQQSGGTTGGTGNSNTTVDSTGPGTHDPNAPSLFASQTLLDNFSNQDPCSTSATGFGQWTKYVGSANNDSSASFNFTAPGVEDYAATYSYVTGTGAYSYSIFSLGRQHPLDLTAAGVTGVRFWAKGTGVGKFNVVLNSTYPSSSDGYTTYVFAIGTAPTAWTLYEIPFANFIWDPGSSATQDYTKEQAMQSFVGIQFETTTVGGAQGTFVLDDLSLGCSGSTCINWQDSNSQNSNNGGGSGSSGSQNGNFSTLVLIDDFSSGDPCNASPAGYGNWQSSQGGANSDGNETLSLTAAGRENEGALFSYTTDSGAWAYSNFGFSGSTFDLTAASTGFTGISFWMKGTGAGNVKVLLGNTNTGPSNNYDTYKYDLGVLPNQWTQYNLMFSDFAWDTSNGGTQNYTLLQAEQDFTGITFEINDAGSVTGTVSLDDLYFGK